MPWLSNLPPGVSGNEYAISGPEREWEEDRECPHCGVTQTMHHEWHREFGNGGVAFCPDPDCEGRFGIDLEVEEPDPDEMYDRARDERSAHEH